MLPESGSAVSPLNALSLERFKGSTYQVENIVTVGTTRATLIPNNPNRLFWMAINESANDVRVSIDPGISTTSGWLLPASGGLISSWWEQDGEGVGYEVFAISSVAGNNIRVREVLRK